MDMSRDQTENQIEVRFRGQKEREIRKKKNLIVLKTSPRLKRAEVSAFEWSNLLAEDPSCSEGGEASSASQLCWIPEKIINL